jgi:hypothetical protein
MNEYNQLLLDFKLISIIFTQSIFIIYKSGKDIQIKILTKGSFMKKIMFALIVITNVSFATVISGAQVLHTLKCSSNIIPTVGSEVGLQVTTQALAPQYSVRAIALTTKAIVPNAKVVTTQLKQNVQTAYNATFVGKNVKVELDKGALKAELTLGAISYSCK